MDNVFKGHRGIGDKVVTGQALVARDGFSARYDMDIVNGVFSRPNHKLYGKKFGNRVLVLDIAKGGVASAWMLNVLMKSPQPPNALILNRANPIIVQGASFGGMPLVDRFDVDITQKITTGDWLRVNPEAGEVMVL